MSYRKIVCNHCGSNRIEKDSKIKYAVVQEKDPKTNKPIGPPKTFLVYKCLSCGEGIYLEKLEAKEFETHPNETGKN
jgi:DNA-directed RNA polymerase subunit RPC12/RpoP